MAGPGGPYVGHRGVRPYVRGPSGPGVDGGRRDDVAAIRDGTAAGGDGPAGREARRARHGRVTLGGDVCHTGAEAGSALPDAAPVASNRHCSPVLLGSCPPACLRHMGSARANRPGWSPGSVWKEFVRWEPRGATSGVGCGNTRGRRTSSTLSATPEARRRENTRKR